MHMKRKTQWHVGLKKNSVAFQIEALRCSDTGYTKQSTIVKRRKIRTVAKNSYASLQDDGNVAI